MNGKSAANRERRGSVVTVQDPANGGDGGGGVVRGQETDSRERCAVNGKDVSSTGSATATTVVPGKGTTAEEKAAAGSSPDLVDESSQGDIDLGRTFGGTTCTRPDFGIKTMHCSFS